MFTRQKPPATAVASETCSRISPVEGITGGLSGTKGGRSILSWSSSRPGIAEKNGPALESNQLSDLGVFPDPAVTESIEINLTSTFSGSRSVAQLGSPTLKTSCRFVRSWQAFADFARAPTRFADLVTARWLSRENCPLAGAKRDEISTKESPPRGDPNSMGKRRLLKQSSATDQLPCSLTHGFQKGSAENTRGIS